MKGVILYADNHLRSEKRGEKELFESLSAKYPVLGVTNLELAKEALQSASGFKAIILDWDFSDEEKEDSLDISEELGTQIKLARPGIRENETMSFLRENYFYTLVYIFSQVDVKSFFPEELMQKFEGRIQFLLKGNLDNVEEVHDKIIGDIDKWQVEKANLSIPIKWSASINQSIQQIFSELGEADINWLVTLYETASSDGVNPEIEVINLLQNILTEKIITNVPLLNEIKSHVLVAKREAQILQNGNSIAKLFQRIYYTDLSTFSLEDVPVMTGDIFLLEAKNSIYGIIVSPECDIQDICDGDLFFELLTFQESNFSKLNFIDLFGQKNNKVTIDSSSLVSKMIEIAKDKFIKFSADSKPPALYSKIRKKIPISDEDGKVKYLKEESYEMIADDVLIKPFISQFEALLNKHVGQGLRTGINEQISSQNMALVNDLFEQAYNQTEKRIHLIPSFNFADGAPNKTAVIDFRSGKAFKKFAELKEAEIKRPCKLNHPFIAELRQRYLAYYGRVGVPKIPTVLREYNLKSFTE